VRDPNGEQVHQLGDFRRVGLPQVAERGPEWGLQHEVEGRHRSLQHLGVDRRGQCSGHCLFGAGKEADVGLDVGPDSPTGRVRCLHLFAHRPRPCGEDVGHHRRQQVIT
jgi:hypothetical protein